MAGLDGLTNLTGGMNFGMFGTVLKFILWGAVFGVLGWLLFYYMSFNIKVEFLRKTNEGFITTWKKGRFKKDKSNPGVEIFQILGMKGMWDQPLDRSYLSAEQKSLGRFGYMVRFSEDNQGRLQPVKPMDKGVLVEWVGWDNNSMEFTTRKAKEYIDRFKKGDFWTKYGALIQMGFMVFLFVAMIVLFREIKSISESLSGVAGALQQVATSLQPVVTNATGTQIITG